DVYLSLEAQPAAFNTFLAAIRRYGPQARLMDPPSPLGFLTLTADRAAAASAAMERLIAGKAASFEQRLVLARLYRSAGWYDRAAAQMLAILDVGPAGRPPGR